MRCKDLKLVFIHSAEKVKRDSLGTLYTDGSYNDEIWKMYLKVFSSITLVMREDENIYSVLEAKEKFNEIPKENISFISLPNLSNSMKSYFSINLRKERDKIIKKAINEADAVIVRIPGIDKAINFAKDNKKICLAEVVGCPFDSLWNHSFKGKILAPISYLQMRIAVKKADNLIYVTEKFLQKRYPTKGNSIGCSDVRLTQLDKNKLENRIKKISDFKNSKIIIGTASGLGVKYKGQQYVIKALSNLKKDGWNNFEYQIAGNGNKSYLEKIIKKYNVSDCVNFVGSIPHNEIFDWYDSLDVYIQPSKQEGLPRALVEAMSCAIPCMGSKVGGIPELLTNSVIFKKGSVKEIEKILLKMLDPDFRREQSKKCFDKSRKYQVEILEKRRIDFMRKIFEVKNEK